MGRAGVTFEDIEKVALQLQDRGKNPTVDAIREQLGTGSKSTIAQHLNTWKSKNDISSGKLPHELQALLTRLWERVHAQAESRITDIENSSDKQIQELKQNLLQSQRDNADLKNQLQKLEENLEVERQTKIEGEKQLQQEKQQHDKLQERHKTQIQQLEEQKAENSRLHQLATNIQLNLEHYQQAVQQQRVEQGLIIEKQQTEFQQKISVLQQELSSHHQKLISSEQQLTQKNLELQQLKDQHLVLQQNHKSQTQQMHENTRELILTKERCEQHQQQLESYQIELMNKNHQLMEFEKQTAILIDYRDRSQKTLSTEEDKIESLRQEKLLLTQQLSELQGYLKHVKNVTTLK